MRKCLTHLHLLRVVEVWIVEQKKWDDMAKQLEEPVASELENLAAQGEQGAVTLKDEIDALEKKYASSDKEVLQLSSS